jgi:hypothetical protein
VNFTYNFTTWSQVYVGYSIIWLSSVQRPGEAIDTVAQKLGIMTREQMDALLVPEKLTEPLRLQDTKETGTKPA